MENNPDDPDIPKAVYTITRAPLTYDKLVFFSREGIYPYVHEMIKDQLLVGTSWLAKQHDSKGKAFIKNKH